MTMRSIGMSQKKVKRNHTLDRRRGYQTPTDADIRCPFFDDTFFKMGDANIVNDMVPVCKDKDGSVSCDYKHSLVDGQLYLCHRYWKEDINAFKPSTGGDVLKEKEQHLDVRYDYIREFVGKSAVIEANIFLKGDKAAWLKDVTWDDFPAIGSTDWRKIGSDMIVTTANSSDSRLIYNGEYANNLEDYEFSVKGYVAKDQWDGDWVGVVFRRSDLGFYQLYWDGGDNKGYLTLMRYTLGNGHIALKIHPGLQWKHGVHYEYFISVKGMEISYKIIDITNNVLIVEHTLTDVDPTLKQGSFGVYASSQEEAYFYNIYGQGAKMVTSDMDSGLKQSIALHWNGIDLTKPIGELFTDAINRAKNNPAYADYSIDRIEYKIVSHNVFESIYFAGTKTNKTTDGTQKITIENYDYDKPLYYAFKMTIGEDERTMQTHDKTFPKDATITKISVGADAQRFRDSFYVAINANPAYVVHSVVNPSYIDLVEHYVPVSGLVRFAYQPSYMPLEFYTGPSIDTHNKKWGIRNNELGWHKVEVYDNE